MERLLLFLMFLVSCIAFAPPPLRIESRSSSLSSSVCHNREIYQRSFALKASPNESEEYVNPITKALGKFIANENKVSVVDTIDWNVPKIKYSNLDELANLLDKALTKREWFVTGNVDPSFFSDDFAFQDPDVKIKGIKEYAKGVNKIFSQSTSRAEVITVLVNNTIPDTLTVTWRLSGAVNLGAGLKIKPYVVYTDLRVSPDDGLIVFQEDRFSIPGYDILLSALFPFLVTAGWLLPPAKSVEELRKSLMEP